LKQTLDQLDTLGECLMEVTAIVCHQHQKHFGDTDFKNNSSLCPRDFTAEVKHWWPCATL
jgi:hypothetical protein